MALRRTVGVLLAVTTAAVLGADPAWSAAPQVALTVVATVPVGAGPMTPLLDEAAGRVFVPNAFGGTVTVVDTGSRSVASTVPVAAVEGEELRAAVLDAARSRLFVLTDSNRVVTVDTRTTAVVRRETVPDEAQDLALDASRGLVYALSSQPGRVTTLASPSGRTLRSIRIAREPDVLAVNPRSGRLFLDDRLRAGGAVTVVDPRTGAVVWSVRPADGVVGFAFDRSGRRAYVPLAGDGGSGALLVLDTRARRIVARIDVGVAPRVAVLDPVHRQAYVATGAGAVAIVDTTTLARTGDLAVAGWLERPAIDTARSRLYVPADSTAGGTLSVYDTGTNQPLTSLPLPRRPGTPAIDSAGARLYVCSGETQTLAIVAVTP